MNPTILAIDASSHWLGYCLYDGAVIASGEIALKDDDIAVRCRLAYAQLNGLLELYALHRPDAIAIEAPASRFAKSLIPQCRVSGALLACASLRGLLVVEVTPSQAKRALSGYGAASKLLMEACAWERYGVRGEHAADAVGVAIAACKLVQVERQAA
jgi:Holliday junction resolvasome RuvABC endonuclease subunit